MTAPTLTEALATFEFTFPKVIFEEIFLYPPDRFFPDVPPALSLETLSHTSGLPLDQVRTQLKRCQALDHTLAYQAAPSSFPPTLLPPTLVDVSPPHLLTPRPSVYPWALLDCPLDCLSRWPRPVVFVCPTDPSRAYSAALNLALEGHGGIFWTQEKAPENVQGNPKRI